MSEHNAEKDAGRVKPHRCPKCKGTALSVIEVHDEHGETDPGEVFIIDGRIKPPSEFWFSAGLPNYVGFRCADCGHQWRSRWTVGFFLDSDFTPPAPTGGDQ